MAATALHDPLGDLLHIDGHLIDITRSLHRDRLSVDPADLVVVEQAAGTLMATHSINASRAHTLLAQVARALIRPSVDGAGADTGVVPPPPTDGAAERSGRKGNESP